jgi:hypothetical protein
MLTALLQTIKHSREDDLQRLTGLIRGPSRPDAVAACLREHFTALQSKGIIPLYDIDDTDVISFGLQGLCGHRKGRARPKSPNVAQHESNEERSPTVMSVTSQESVHDFGDETTFDQGDSASSSPLHIGQDQPFDSISSYDPNSLLGSSAVDSSTSQDFFPTTTNDTLSSSLFSHHDSRRQSFQQTPAFSHPSSNSTESGSRHSFAGHASSTATMPALTGSMDFSIGRRQSVQPFSNDPESFSATPPGSHPYMMQYYHAMANGIPNTLDPAMAAKYGHHAMLSQPGMVDSGPTLSDDFGNPPFALHPLRSNA